MGYAENKAKAKTKTRTETMTDQAAAYETDRNVIVNRYMVHGQTPTGGKPPMYGDFSRLPTDLAGFIQGAKKLKELKAKLPKELQGKSTQELMRLTPQELTEILTPPAPKPEDNKEIK